jgi:integrase
MMINAGDTITKEQLNRESLKLSEALKKDDVYQGAITAQKLDNGAYVVLSCYPDMVWQLNPNKFPDNTVESQRKIDFTTVPSCFVAVAKRYAAKNIRKGLAGGTVVNYAKKLKPFLDYLQSINVTSTSQITPLVAMQYVEHCKTFKQSVCVKSKSKTLSKGDLALKFLAVERLHQTLAGTVHAFVYPWPESSANHLAGNKHNGAAKPKTEVIPDDVFVRVFQYANGYLERANELLDLREEIEKIREDYSNFSQPKTVSAINKHLKDKGYKGKLARFNQELRLLESSCWLIIMATTGVRIHELGGLKANSYHTRDDDGERYCFIESKSLKTGEGETSWLCPEIAIDALKVMTRITQPLRVRLVKQIDSAEAKSDYLKASNLKRIQHSCVLSVVQKKNNAIGVLSDLSVNTRLNQLAKAAGVDWHFTSHQFRRTFAHFVVHNQLGDLRYLRDHFKHWSLDMTALYALDDDLDLELFNEINFAYREKGEKILEHWMDSDTPIAGGLKDRIIALRNSDEAVKTYGSRANMMRAMSDNIIVRSTGIAWCTNDTFGCGGGQCEDCSHSVIDESHQYQWEAMYAQQIELREIANEVGPSGTATIERTIKRCERVLTDLGADMNAIKERVAGHV